MYKKILVAVDGSNTSNLALGEAIRLAKLMHAELRAVHVLENSVAQYAYAGYFDPDALAETTREEGRLVLDDAQQRFAKDAVQGEVVVAEVQGLADVPSTLEEYARTWGADLVVLGRHGRRGVRRMVLGSVAEQFLIRSSCPVLLVRGQEG